MFCASPVYFLAISTFRELAKSCDLIILNRGTKDDWGTKAFRDIATEWHNVQNFDAETLANAIKRQSLDVLFDLGGWSDPIGLKALSVKPAKKMYKWVGGQSATTGLTVFDGFITDDAQSPVGSERLHSEPLVRLKGSYVHYTPPHYMPSKRSTGKDGASAIVGNPAKLSDEFLSDLKKLKCPLRFIERRYKLDKARRRINSFCGPNVDFIAPDSHFDYLAHLGRQKTIVDTRPYSCGLTAMEALYLGVPIDIGDGSLFSSRHAIGHKAKYTPNNSPKILKNLC
jgi:predicted O-linked N-acetylglucosamine transferase (SPINDLY family)